MDGFAGRRRTRSSVRCSGYSRDRRRRDRWRHQGNQLLLDDGVVGCSDTVGLELRLGRVAQPVDGRAGETPSELDAVVAVGAGAATISCSIICITGQPGRSASPPPPPLRQSGSTFERSSSTMSRAGTSGSGIPRSTSNRASSAPARLTISPPRASARGSASRPAGGPGARCAAPGGRRNA